MKGACPRGHLLSVGEQGQQETNSSPAGAEGTRLGSGIILLLALTQAGMQKMVRKQKTGDFQ